MQYFIPKFLGAATVPELVFVLISLISRGLRFFIVSYLSYKFGELFTEFMNKHGSKWFTIIGILIVVLGIIIYLISKFHA